MLKGIKGPGIFLAQFVRSEAPYNSIRGLAKWVSSLGYAGVQVPTWSKEIFDLDKAAASKYYCQDYQQILNDSGLEIIELASYLQGQVMAIHPAYEVLFQSFYPKGLNDRGRLTWATDQLKKTITASAHFGTKNISVLSGGLAWPYIYPWPQRSNNLIDEAFEELASRWLPLLDLANENGITFGFELHPGSDLCDGATYLRFLEKVNNHSAACITYDASHFLLQQLDYTGFIKMFAERIKAFHVKDAEFRPSPLTGVYGGFNNWRDRAGRFRSPGDGQIDFKQIFSLLTEKGYNGWAILEWECFIKSPEQGAREGSAFIQKHLVEVAQYAFDDFARSLMEKNELRKILGLQDKNITHGYPE